MTSDTRFFPYKEIRPVQNDLINKITDFYKTGKKILLIEAPTGLGKTISALSCALSYVENDNHEKESKGYDLSDEKNKGKTIFFVTSKNTQHIVANDTINDIHDFLSRLNNKRFTAIDLLGKSNMCLYSTKNKSISSTIVKKTQSLFDFSGKKPFGKKPITDVKTSSNLKNIEYICAKLKEYNKCAYFTKTMNKGKLSPEASFLVTKLNDCMIDSSNLKVSCAERQLCPYELAMNMTKRSKIIVCDYNYIFNSRIRNTLLQKAEISMEDIVLVVDEAHNLPDRVISYMSANLNLDSLNALNKHLSKNSSFNSLCKELRSIIEKVEDAHSDAVSDERKPTNEIKIDRSIVTFDENLVSGLESALEYLFNDPNDEYFEIVDNMLEFIALWKDSDDESYVHYIKENQRENQSTLMQSEQKINKSLCARCLDPSKITKSLLNQFDKTVLMSATLQPIDMYVDILGIDNYDKAIFPSPFPEDNKKAFVLANATTKYTERTLENYTRIANSITNILNKLKKNAILFFPSYEYKEHIKNIILKSLEGYHYFEESSILSQREREELLENFKQNQPSILFAVTLGSFSESIDLPGDLLNIVFIIGLPLKRQSLEVASVINYYDNVFDKGKEYGYFLPAIAKTLQAAGRCIRTSDDKGVIVFYDYRFANPSFFEYLEVYKPEIVKDEQEIISECKDFFD